MKKFLFIAAICAAFIACKSNDPEGPKQSVTFKVKGFEQSTEPMNSPRRAPQATILDDEGGTALTDLYVFDGTTQLIHQTNDQENFGEVTLDLTYGQHNLSFICTRSTGITYNAGVLTFTGVRSTFGKILALNVGGNTANQSVELNRISGLLNITITDEFPANANQIEFIIATKYTKINVESLCAVEPYEFTQKVSCASKVGQSNVLYSMVILCPTLDQEYTSDMTINVYDSGNNIIRSVTIDDVRFAANTKTMLSGPLFSGTGASITVNTTWNQDIVGNF